MISNEALFYPLQIVILAEYSNHQVAKILSILELEPLAAVGEDVNKGHLYLSNVFKQLPIFVVWNIEARLLPSNFTAIIIGDKEKLGTFNGRYVGSLDDWAFKVTQPSMDVILQLRTDAEIIGEEDRVPINTFLLQAGQDTQEFKNIILNAVKQASTTIVAFLSIQHLMDFILYQWKVNILNKY